MPLEILPARYALQRSWLFSKKLYDLADHLVVVCDDATLRTQVSHTLARQQVLRGGGLLWLDGWANGLTEEFLHNLARTSWPSASFWSVAAWRNPSSEDVLLASDPLVLRKRLLEREVVYAGPDVMRGFQATRALVEQLLEGLLQGLALREHSTQSLQPYVVVLDHCASWVCAAVSRRAQDLLEKARQAGVVLVGLMSGEDFALEMGGPPASLAAQAGTLVVGRLRQSNWPALLEHPLAQRAGLRASHLTGLRSPTSSIVLQHGGKEA